MSAGATRSWDDLRLVLAVAEGGGLGAAAERLGLNGSTVFRRLAAIEAELGLTLFERHRSGYVATPAGQEIVTLAARMEADVAALALRLAGQSQVPAGEVRVTTNDTLLIHLLTPIFAAFRQAHPGVTLDVVLSNEVLNLARRDADVAIRAAEEPPETLLGRRLATVGWAIYGPADFIGDDLAAADWVALGIGTAPVTRFLLDHVRPERVVYRINTVLGLTEAVAAGIGLGALPCFVADRYPGLRRIAAARPELTRSLWLLTHPNLRDTPRVRVFVDFVARAIGAQRTAMAGRE